MPRYLPAHHRPAAFFMECPYCGEGICCPRSGSLMLTGESIPNLGIKRTNGPARMPCPTCGREFAVPLAVRQLD